MKIPAILLGVGLAFIWLCATFDHITPEHSNYDMAAGFSAAIALILAVATAVAHNENKSK